MKVFKVYKSILMLIAVAFLFSACSKNDDDNNTGDPSNLTIDIISINDETGFVQIQATAQNANLYQLYLYSNGTPEAANNTGYFEYTFDGQGTHQFNIRAYGSSGKYIKKEKEIVIASEPEEIPLSRGYYSPESYQGYSLVWQDEFNGTSLNTAIWQHEIGTGTWGWGNNELQYYRAENAWVGDSVLTIEARKENFSGQLYTSSRMKSQGNFSFKYGRVDARALLPEGKGMWPAIWMLGSNFNQAGWPACGEVDIMEMIGGSENTVFGTAHWEYNAEHASSGGSGLTSGAYNLAQAYHVFSIEWDENYIRWYLDGNQFYVLNITDSNMTEFHQPFFFILNLAVGGNWPGSPTTATIFPQQLKIDYIRVFQQDK